MRRDKTPSFSFYKRKDNEVLYKDLATGECGDAFKFVKNYKKLQAYIMMYTGGYI